MTRPLLSVIIATQGTDTLPRALASIDPTLAEVIVVADTHTLPLYSDVRATAAQYGAQYAEYDAGFHDWGHPQAGVGMTLAHGRWLAFLGDDDEYVPGGLAAVASAISQLDHPVPLMFRAVMHESGTRVIGDAPLTLWRRHRLIIGQVTGQNIVCPNVPGMLGEWGTDFEFIERTLALNGAVEWREEVIATCW